MKRTILLLTAIAAMLVGNAGAALAEEPTETLDAHVLDATQHATFGFTPGFKQAQTFTVEHSGQINKANVKVWKSAGTIGDLKMEIVSVNALGQPTNNVLASTSLPASEVSTTNGGTLETFTFNTPAGVEQGKKYAFVMDATEVEGQFYAVVFDMAISPGYPGGEGYWLRDDYSLFQQIPDHIFAIYVGPDTTAPVLMLPDDITAEATGPNGAQVSWQAPTATDGNPINPDVTCSKNSGDIFPLGTTTVTCTATDAAGNKATDSFDVTVRDTTAPAATHEFWNNAQLYVHATSSSGATVDYLKMLPDANAVLTATDLVDGEVRMECSPTSGTTFPIGPTDVTCTATDAAGNSTVGVIDVRVVYNWSGLLQPINGGTTLDDFADDTSVFKVGSTVPVKFALVGESAGIKDASVTFDYVTADDGIEGTVMENTSTATPTSGNLFRYDATSGQYVYNWSTKGLTAGTYDLYINFGDSNLYTVVISLKK